MREKFRQFKEIVSWIILSLLIILVAVLIITNLQARKTGDLPFILNHMPAYVRSGSMEPYMLTHGFILTQKVNSMDDIQVGDVITFSVSNSSGSKVLVTHRLIGINEDGTLNTQGDNNNTPDLLPITIDDVEAKVVLVFNFPAHIISLWQMPAGKVMILCFVGMLVFGYYSIKLYLKARREEQNAKLPSSASVLQDEQANLSP